MVPGRSVNVPGSFAVGEIPPSLLVGHKRTGVTVSFEGVQRLISKSDPPHVREPCGAILMPSSQILLPL